MRLNGRLVRIKMLIAQILHTSSRTRVLLESRMTDVDTPAHQTFIVAQKSSTSAYLKRLYTLHVAYYTPLFLRREGPIGGIQET